MHNSAAHRGRSDLALSDPLVIRSAHRQEFRLPRIGPMPACFFEQGGSQRRGGASAPQKAEKFKMPIKKMELKTFTRDEWLALDNKHKDQLEILVRNIPLVLYTDASRTFSTVRRMKAEKTMGLPINLRTGFAISVETGKAANAMTEDEWEKFYFDLSERLNGDYPGLYARRVLGPIKAAKKRRETKPLPYVDALYARAACWFNRRFPFSHLTTPTRRRGRRILTTALMLLIPCDPVQIAAASDQLTWIGKTVKSRNSMVFLTA